MGNRKDYTGMKFNSLTVISDAPYRITKGGIRLRTLNCVCDCGNQIRIDVNNLTSGHIKSCRQCGYMRSGESRKTHGQTNTRLYRTWVDMKTRCYNANSINYHKYGAKGITVCDEWLGDHGFENFFKWSYANGFVENANGRTECSIDRIDFTKSYSPDNCRWTTSKTQSVNRSNNNYIVDKDGEEKALIQIAEKYDISYGTISSRYRRGVRDIDKLTELTIKGSGIKRVAHFGETKYHKKQTTV